VKSKDSVNIAVISMARALVNTGKVNSGGFHFLPAGKIAISCDFTRKSAIQKVR
jgi:hypothetical protein